MLYQGPAIRPIQISDEPAVVDICYRTGYMGEDLTGSGRFNDKWLFGLLFALYYVRYEMKTCFVSMDSRTGAVLGYILGAADSALQEKRFSLLMIWRIAARALLYSSWRHPESFRTLLHFNRVQRTMPPLHDLYKDFPAHLHINMAPGYQGRGMGSALIERFEESMRSRGACGVHLVTSERNTRALSFYERHGYSVIRELSPGLWPDAPGVRGLVHAKRLEAGRT